MILRLRELRRTDQPQLVFYRKTVNMPLPCGIASLSPFADTSLGLPSWLQNSEIDFLQEIQVAMSDTQPIDQDWPSKPPRGDVYCDSSALVHPLVCSTTAYNWSGASPLWVACGEERCADGIKVLASRMAQQGVPVIFSEYKGLPHIFAVMLSLLPQSQRCYHEWAAACLCFAEGGKAMSTGQVIDLPGDNVKKVDGQNIASVGFQDALSRMKIAVNSRPPWMGPTATKL